MAAKTDVALNLLLPTPKRAEVREGGFGLRQRLPLYVSASLLGLQQVYRQELAKLGAHDLPPVEERSAAAIALLDDRDMPRSIREALERERIPGQAYNLLITDNAIAICALSRGGALNALATLLQWIELGGSETVTAVEIMDSPDMERRIISPTLTWYAGFARAGFGTQLWDGERWQTFVDWCFRHKINALNIVMYGFWPFEFEAYPETVLRDIKVRSWSKEINGWVETSFTHPNLQRPFLTEMIHYANERGIEVYAYIGMNSYSGGYPVAHPESRAQLSEELRAKGHVNSYDSMCPSLAEVRRYLVESVKRIEELGFNGLVFEESEEVQWFCQCDACQAKYGHLPPNEAKHYASLELLQDYLRVLKEETVVGLRWLREPPVVKSKESLEAWRERLPERVALFWAPGLEDDDREFMKWADVFGPDRIWSRNCEGSGFAASLGRIPYLIPDTFPASLQNYAFQHLWNDIAQFQGAVNLGCAAINGYGFEWYGHELYFMATAQYGWDCWRFDRERFLAHASRHLHGEVNGPVYERVVRRIPCIHETQICPTLPSFPFMPDKYVGKEGLAYLEACGRDVDVVLSDLRFIVRSPDLTTVQRENAEATLVMARRMKEVIEAGIAFNRFKLEEAEAQASPERPAYWARQALMHAEADWRIIRESYFDTDVHDWTGVPIGEYYIPMVINEYKKAFQACLGDSAAPDETVAYMVGGESLPWEWLLEWGPRIAAAKPLAAVRASTERQS